MTAHTPAPFISLEVNETSREAPCGCVLRHTDQTPSITLCHMHAAAPELLSACKVIMPWAAKGVVDHQNQTIGGRALDRAIAAIAKAGGT